MQLKSPLSVVVEIVYTTTATKNGVIFKVVNKDEERRADRLRDKERKVFLHKQLEWRKHFIVPYLDEREEFLWYGRAHYNPLDEETACKCWRTFTEKVHDALELHKFQWICT